MNDRTQLSRRHMLGTTAALACGAAFAAAQEPAQATAAAPAGEPSRPRTVILVRHAEKATDDPRDPSLSETGVERAAALLRLLGETKVTHVWTSEFKRTIATAKAVVEKHKLTAERLPGKEPLMLAARLAEMSEGSVALVVGHSNTVPAVAKALGAPLSNLAKGTDLRDDEYDRFVVITFARGGEPASLLELRYGV